MSIRYSDMSLEESGAMDFVARQRTPTPVQLGIILLTVFVICVSVVLSVSSQTSLLTVLFIIFAMLGWYVIVTIIRSRDVLLATEFQNAIFASALGLHNKFNIIIKRDGMIVYIDRSFQSLFPDFIKQNNRTLDSMLRSARINRASVDQIQAVIDKGEYGKVLMDVTDANHKIHHVVLPIEPILRPAGFIMLRGREYISDRRDSQAKSSAPSTLLAKSSITLFSPVMESMKMGIYISSPDGQIVYCNSLLEQWLQYDENELAGRNLTIDRIVPPARNDHFNPIVADFEGHVQLEKKVGGFITAFLNQKVIYNEDGKPAGCTAIVHVVEEPDGVAKKNPVASSVTSNSNENILDQFIAGSPIAMALVDESNNLIFGNLAFHALAKHTLTTSLPVPFSSLLNEAHKTEALGYLTHMHSPDYHGDPYTLELRLESGEEIIVSCYGSRFSESHMLLHLINITEQKQLELRFTHSQKMQAVGQLAGGVAHDFNNLLTAMIGFCDLLLMRHPAGDQSFADIMQIKQNANRAANLVRQLLAFSRRQTLQPKLLEMTDVLAELSNLIRRLIGENIELKVIHGRDIGTIRADQGQLEQVLINLAVNARDAMKGGGTLTIRTNVQRIDRQHRLPADLIAPSEEDYAIVDGEYIVVDVEDTGTGIPPAIIQKIFEPFFSTKEVGSGTGLGLSTVYGIIKQSGGFLYVRSVENKGTTFSLYFPQASSQQSESERAAQDAAQKEVHTDLTGSNTILLVEDEMTVRDIATRALKNKGYQVIEADCAETALDLMKEFGNDVELIISDVIMPGMTGPTFVDKITPDYPNIKVIFISGYAEDVLNNYGEGRSFNFLPKPFTLKQLVSKVKEVLG